MSDPRDIVLLGYRVKAYPQEITIVLLVSHSVITGRTF
jgi:hypothetical protein